MKESNQEISFLQELEKIIYERKEKMPEGSYTSKLFQGGKERILKKVGEESAETIIASMKNSREEMIYESADLVYHLMIALAEMDLNLSHISEELRSRHKPDK